MKYVPHSFMPNHTIDAVLRLKNRHNMTSEELEPLRAEFNRINGLVVPRPGVTYQIPVLENGDTARVITGIS